MKDLELSKYNKLMCFFLFELLILISKCTLESYFSVR